MKIFYKINILILVSVLALLGMSLMAGVFKSQELQYYTLVEQVTRLENKALIALTRQKDFEKNFQNPETVFEAL